MGRNEPGLKEISLEEERERERRGEREREERGH